MPHPGSQIALRFLLPDLPFVPCSLFLLKGPTYRATVSFTGEEKEGKRGRVWRVKTDSRDFQDAIVREGADMSSQEIRRLIPGNTCVQSGPMVCVDPGVVRMPILPKGWVTVHARSIGGPTFLEILPEESSPGEEPMISPKKTTETNRANNTAEKAATTQEKVVTEADLEINDDVEGLSLKDSVYPLAFLLRYKLHASPLEPEHLLSKLKVLRIPDHRPRKHKRPERKDEKRRDNRAEKGGTSKETRNDSGNDENEREKYSLAGNKLKL